MDKIDIHQVDDWIAIYKNGKRIYSDHSITGEDMLDLLGIPYESTYHEGDAVYEYAMSGMVFPDTLEELEAIDDEVIEGLL